MSQPPRLTTLQLQVPVSPSGAGTASRKTQMGQQRIYDFRRGGAIWLAKMGEGMLLGDSPRVSVWLGRLGALAGGH